MVPRVAASKFLLLTSQRLKEEDEEILRNTSIDLDPGAEMKIAISTILRSARFRVVT